MNLINTLNLAQNYYLALSLIIIFAAIIGSFLSLISHRLFSKQKIVFARSQCVNCCEILRAKNLIPILSFLFQKGKCSFCNNRISIRYFLIEISTMVIFLINFFYFNKIINFQFLIFCLISATLILMVITDLEHYAIPNILQYFLITFCSIFIIHQQGNLAVISNYQAAFIYLGFSILIMFFYYLATKIEALGIDDLKFFFIAGFILGMKNFLFFMMLSGLIGVLFGLIWQKFKNDKYFPYAPAICFSLYLSLLVADKIDLVKILSKLILA